MFLMASGGGVVRHGNDAQGVNLFVHQASERIIHEAMSRQCGQIVETTGNYGEFEMLSTRAGAGVAGMFVRFVNQLNVLWLKRRQALPDGFFQRHAGGSTCLNGFTVTRAYTQAAT